MVAEKALRRLSRKEEVFCRLVVAGKNFAEAYREAYSSESPNAKVNGRRVSLRTHVRARIEELQKPDEKRLFASRAFKREMLFNMMHNAKLDPMDRQRALDLDNKMDGSYKTVVQVEGEITLLSVMAALNGSGPLPSTEEAIDIPSFPAEVSAPTSTAVVIAEPQAAPETTVSPGAAPEPQKRSPGPFEEDLDLFTAPTAPTPQKRRSRVYPA